MTDISPKLYQKILQDFDELVSADKTLASLAENMTDYRKAALYAQRLGEHLSTVLQKNLTAGVLPDEKLYYNIANATVLPMLENNRDLVNLIAKQAQEALNESAGIGIKAITPAPKNKRIDGIIDKLSNADNIDDVAWVMGEPIINTTQSFVDDNIEANTNFHLASGLSPIIKRITSGDCCEWCAKRAGTYDYSADMEHDVFQRHDRCRCMVLYDPKDGRSYQNTHKQSEWYGSLDESELERRKKYGLSDNITNAEIERRKTVGIKQDNSKKYPVNPVTGERYIDHDIIITSQQFGKKAGKHAIDYGLDPSDKTSREWLMNYIKDITKNADERAFGEWRYQEYPVVFHIKAEDVVVESKDGKFITLLKGGVNNERVKNARK